LIKPTVYFDRFLIIVKDAHCYQYRDGQQFLSVTIENLKETTVSLYSFEIFAKNNSNFRTPLSFFQEFY